MYKTITIEGKEIPMMSNGGTLCEYRRFFKRDMIGDYFNMESSLKSHDFEKFDSLALARMMWVCAYRANPKIKKFEKWIEDFESPFSFFDAIQDFSELLSSGFTTNVEPKKKKSLKKP